MVQLYRKIHRNTYNNINIGYKKMKENMKTDLKQEIYNETLRDNKTIGIQIKLVF